MLMKEGRKAHTTKLRTKPPHDSQRPCQVQRVPLSRPVFGPPRLTLFLLMLLNLGLTQGHTSDSKRSVCFPTLADSRKKPTLMGGGRT